MKKLMIAAATIAAFSTSAMASDLNTAGDDLEILSTQAAVGAGLGGLGVAGTVAALSFVVVAAGVASGANSSSTGTQ